MENLKLTKELYESPMKERNLDKYGEDWNSCICCGKPIKEEKISLYINMNTDWEAVHFSVDPCDIEKVTGSECQGSYPVGPECAKHMKGYTYKRN